MATEEAVTTGYTRYRAGFADMKKWLALAGLSDSDEEEEVFCPCGVVRGSLSSCCRRMRHLQYSAVLCAYLKAGHVQAMQRPHGDAPHLRLARCPGPTNPCHKQICVQHSCRWLILPMYTVQDSSNIACQSRGMQLFYDAPGAMILCPAYVPQAGCLQSYKLQPMCSCHWQAQIFELAVLASRCIRPPSMRSGVAPPPGRKGRQLPLLEQVPTPERRSPCRRPP